MVINNDEPAAPMIEPIPVDSTAILRQAVFELRRNSPRYVTYQGQIAEDLLEEYGSFTVEPGQVRMLEAVRFISDDNRIVGSVNGTQSVFIQTPPASIEEFAENSERFFRISERRLEPKGYDRVGLLFGFYLSVPGERLGDWFRDRFGRPGPSGWNADDFSVRLQRSAQSGDEYLTAKALFMPVPGNELDGPTVYSGIVRIDLDRAFYRLHIDSLAELDVIETFDRAATLLNEFLGKVE